MPGNSTENRNVAVFINLNLKYHGPLYSYSLGLRRYFRFYHMNELQCGVAHADTNCGTWMRAWDWKWRWQRWRTPTA